MDPSIETIASQMREFETRLKKVQELRDRYYKVLDGPSFEIEHAAMLWRSLSTACSMLAADYPVTIVGRIERCS